MWKPYLWLVIQKHKKIFKEYQGEVQHLRVWKSKESSWSILKIEQRYKKYICENDHGRRRKEAGRRLRELYWD